MFFYSATMMANGCDVITCAAVNAGAVYRSLATERDSELEALKIEQVMRERVQSVLYAFERHEVKHIVLGAWGCGVFNNNVKTIANISTDLLARKDSRFRHAFGLVVFAITGEETLKKFEASFEERRRLDQHLEHS